MRLTAKHLILPIAFLALFLVLPESTQAFELFPGEKAGSTDYRIYIQNFYRFSIAAGILIATVLIMIGGIMWTTSAGNASRIDKAKDYITDSIIGVVLLIGAYTILSLINPNLVNLPKVTFPKFGEVGACLTTVGGATSCSDVAQQLCIAPEGSTAKYQGAGTNCATVCPSKDSNGNCVAAGTSKADTAQKQLDAFLLSLNACRGRSTALPNTPTFRFNSTACEDYCDDVSFCGYLNHGEVYTDSAGSQFFQCDCKVTETAEQEQARLEAAVTKAKKAEADAAKADKAKASEPAK